MVMDNKNHKYNMTYETKNISKKLASKIKTPSSASFLSQGGFLPSAVITSLEPLNSFALGKASLFILMIKYDNFCDFLLQMLV